METEEAGAAVTTSTTRQQYISYEAEASFALNERRKFSPSDSQTDMLRRTLKATSAATAALMKNCGNRSRRMLNTLRIAYQIRPHNVYWIYNVTPQ